tara:strand:+ start:256 stop:774 length:519 start_codon:yes stop_codon:yes gene_type:complete
MVNKSIALFLIVFFGQQCLSQGGWDIEYLSIDSVDRNIIGKDVKLDLRSKSDGTKNIPAFLMNFIGLEDSVTILLGGKEIVLKEKRNIHIDWGFYDEQFLECANFSSNETIRIYHSVIEDVNDKSILVRLYVEIYDDYTKEQNNSHIIRRYCESTWIPRELLNGVMIKRVAD